MHKIALAAVSVACTFAGAGAAAASTSACSFSSGFDTIKCAGAAAAPVVKPFALNPGKNISVFLASGADLTTFIPDKVVGFDLEKFRRESEEYRQRLEVFRQDVLERQIRDLNDSDLYNSAASEYNAGLEKYKELQNTYQEVYSSLKDINYVCELKPDSGSVTCSGPGAARVSPSMTLNFDADVTAFIKDPPDSLSRTKALLLSPKFEAFRAGMEQLRARSEMIRAKGITYAPLYSALQVLYDEAMGSYRAFRAVYGTAVHSDITI